MELKWLEDYLALAEHGNFSRAAEVRCVTQPAFGRRIKALESWLGVELIDRHHYPTTLTPLGIEFVEKARHWVESFYDTRAEMRTRLNHKQRVTIVSQHSLTVSFLPCWIDTLRPLIGDLFVRIESHNLHDCVDTFMSGHGDFLLCYHSPHVFPQLERDKLLSIEIGVDRLIPVSAVDMQGECIYSMDSAEPIKVLTYPEETFFGKLLERDVFGRDSYQNRFSLQCENALVEGLKALTLNCNGIAWLPESAIINDLKAGVLKRVKGGLPTPELRIMLYRRNEARVKDVDLIWDHLYAFSDWAQA